MPTPYQMMVTAIESQAGVMLEAAQDCLLEEWRKRKGQSKGGLLMTAMHSKMNSRKPSNSSGNATNITRSNLLCTHCNKRGHVESTCWAKYPHLKDKPKASITGEAKVAFQTAAETTKMARKAHIGGHGNTDGGGVNLTHWIVDSGASEHFMSHKHILIDYRSLDEPVEVNMAQ